MSRERGTPRGVSLLELMVASSLSLLLLAGAMWSAAELQRRSGLEESVMGAQNAMRAVRELLVIELQRAGTGAGSARLVLGTRAGGTEADVRYAITVSTREPFDGSGLFPDDPSFALPSGPHATRVSDAFQVWSWDSEARDAQGRAISLLPLELCPVVEPGAQPMYRQGSTLCPSANPTALLNRLVMVVKPATRTACLMHVTAVNTSTVPAQVSVTPGLPLNPPPVNDVCATFGGPPSDDAVRFWSRDGAGAYLLPVRAVSIRVNWASGGPVLERQERTSDLTQQAPWVALSREVERLRVRLGVTSNLGQPGAPLLWFPEDASQPPRPALDACASDCDGLVPTGSGSWTPGRDEPTARDALMRRLRMVELTMTTRTARADRSMIRREGTGFALDEEGNPRDGLKRRTATVEVMPRNFAHAGVTQ